MHIINTVYLSSSAGEGKSADLTIVKVLFINGTLTGSRKVQYENVQKQHGCEKSDLRRSWEALLSVHEEEAHRHLQDTGQKHLGWGGKLLNRCSVHFRKDNMTCRCHLVVGPLCPGGFGACHACVWHYYLLVWSWYYWVLLFEMSCLKYWYCNLCGLYEINTIGACILFVFVSVCFPVDPFSRFQWPHVGATFRHSGAFGLWDFEESRSRFSVPAQLVRP